jgi:hypothetical protein
MNVSPSLTCVTPVNMNGTEVLALMHLLVMSGDIKESTHVRESSGIKRQVVATVEMNVNETVTVYVIRLVFLMKKCTTILHSCIKNYERRNKQTITHKTKDRVTRTPLKT